MIITKEINGAWVVMELVAGDNPTYYSRRENRRNIFTHDLNRAKRFSSLADAYRIALKFTGYWYRR